MRHTILPFLIPALLVGGAARADDEFDAKYIQTTAGDEVLTQLGLSAYPAAYGELLSAYQIAAENPLAEKMVKQFADDVGMFAQSIGRGINLFDAANKLASGDVAEAGLSLLLTTLSEVAGTDAAKAGERALLGLIFKDAATMAVQPTAVVNAAITAFQIWRESVKQVEETKAAVQAETLYYRIQSDKALFRGAGSGRSLGTGEPIPVTSAASERVFRRILLEPDFREQFKAYVEQQGGSFPEPSWWDQKTTSDEESTAKAAVLRDRGEVDKWIMALLAQLNREAKAREAQQVVANQLRQLQKVFGNGPRLAAEVAAMWEGIKKLPEMEKYAESLPTTIAEAKAKKQFDLLNIITGKIEYTVGKELKHVPQGGTIGARRTKVLASLTTSWRSARAALKSIPTEAAKEFASTAAANPIPAVANGPVFVQTPLAIPTIDEALGDLRKARSMADLDNRIKALMADLERASAAFGEQFGRSNPDRSEQLFDAERRHWKTTRILDPSVIGVGHRERTDFDEQAAKRDPLVMALRGYATQRQAYPQAKSIEYQALVTAITDFQRAVQSTAGEASGRRAEVLAMTTWVTRMGQSPDYRRWVTDQTATAVESLAASVAKLTKPDGYVGYTKLTLPKWGNDGSAVKNYVGGLAYKSTSLLPAWSSLETTCADARKDLAKARQALAMELAELNKNLEAAKARAADYKLTQDGEVAQRIAAAETDVGAARKRADGAEQAGKKADEDCARLQAAAAENIANIQNDSGYLNALLKKIEYWSDATGKDKYGDATIVEVGTVDEATSGTRRKFLAPSRTDLVLFDKAKANAAADALRQDIERTGIAKWDPQGDTGLKALLEAKAAQMRSYFPDSQDYAVVDCCVVYASRITRMANDVRAIPASSYGTNTYKEGLKNRSFEKDLNSALRNGTAFAMDLFVRSDSKTGKIEVTTASLQKVASAASNASVKGAAGEVAKAISEHLTRYNAQVEQENSKFAEDAAKFAAVQAAPAGQTQTMPGAPGQAGVPGQPSPGKAVQGAPGAPPPGMVPAAGTPIAMAQGPIAGGSPLAQQIPASPPGAPQGQALGGVPAGPMAGTPGTQPKPAMPPGLPAAPPAPGAPPASLQAMGSPPPAAPVPSIASLPAGSGPQMQKPAASAQAPAGQPALAITVQNPNTSQQSPLPAASPAPQQNPAAQPSATQGQAPGASQGGPMPAGSSGAPPKPAASPSSPPAPQIAVAQPMAQQPAGLPFGAAAPGSASGPGAPSGAPLQRPAASAQAPGAMPGGPQLAFAQTAPQQPDQSQAIRDLYQKFAEAYQRKDVRGVTKWLSPKWTSASGSSSMDLEETLGNSFRVFDTIQFQIQGLQIQKTSDTEYRASYTALLTGRINRQNLKHEDKASVTDTVSITPEGPRISKTSGGNLWSKK